MRAYAGDIIGLHNHGTIQIGDTFAQGEDLKFTGIPNFAPRIIPSYSFDDPLKQTIIERLSTTFWRCSASIPSIGNNDLIVGAVGVLQFDGRFSSEIRI